MTDEIPQWRKDLADLIEQAKREHKWLFTNSMATGRMWMAPHALAKENAAGRFVWGVDNWRLRDPEEYIAEAKATMDRAIAEWQRVSDLVRYGRTDAGHV